MELKPNAAIPAPIMPPSKVCEIVLGIFNENDVKSAYGKVTRLDFARMIYKFSAFGVSDTELRFTDIDEKDSQYVNYVIEKKYKRGIGFFSNGSGGGTRTYDLSGMNRML